MSSSGPPENVTAAATPALQLSAERSPLPLYHRLYLILHDQISRGIYPPDSLLPSEVELSSLFGVSRITSKRALDELTSEGLVERARGRGTRVVQRPADLPGGRPISASIDGLRESLSVIGRETSVELIEFDYVLPPPHVAEQLHCPPEARVQRAVRVRSLDRVPLSQSTTFVPEDIGSAFGPDELGSTPLIELLERGGVKVASAEQSISAVLAEAAAAQRLRVRVGSALLHLKRTVIAAGGRPVEHIEILYRPDRFEYRMSLTGDQAARRSGFSAS